MKYNGYFISAKRFCPPAFRSIPKQLGVATPSIPVQVATNLHLIIGIPSNLIKAEFSDYFPPLI
jgi:hypothetical protein